MLTIKEELTVVLIFLEQLVNNSCFKLLFFKFSIFLGDHCYKKNDALTLEEQMITSLPDLREIHLDEDDQFMVLACDGIW